MTNVRGAMLKLLFGVMFLFALTECVANTAWAHQPLAFDNPLITISGTSTVRDWSCSVVSRLEAIPSVSVPQSSLQEFTGNVAVSAKVTIIVQNIDCGNETMEEHLRNALKWKKFPEIFFQIKETIVSRDAVRILGDLTIAGVMRSVELTAVLERADEGARVSGKTEINMKDYQVTPPKLMFGMLKVDPNVTLRFSAAVHYVTTPQ